MTTRLESPPGGEKRLPQRQTALAAFAYRDFRLLWFGMLIAMMGFWMQFTSLTYLVGVVLAHSPAQSAINLGLLGAARSLPVFFVGPIAGYVADRYPRRPVLFVTNFVRAAVALGLAFTSQGHGGWVLPAALVLAGIFSAAQSFDSPARQSWISFIVPRPLISNAIGLNSFANNVPLMAGPAIAGVLIATVGVYASFFVQAVTQWAVVIAVIMMRPSPRANTSREPMFKQIASGITFTTSHEVLRWLLLSLIVTCLFVRPYVWLMAAFAAHVLGVDAKGYGTMLAVGGIGTVCGALTTALYQTENRARVWFVSGIVVGVGLIALAFVHVFWMVLVILAIMGWATMSFTSSTNVMTQLLAPDEMRGRAMSLFTIIMQGGVPAGTLIMGTLASVVGMPVTYAAGGVIAVIMGVWVWVAHPVVRKA